MSKSSSPFRGHDPKQKHRRILKLDGELARLLLHLDGTRDRAALRDSERLGPYLDALVERNLRKMAGLALLGG